MTDSEQKGLASRLPGVRARLIKPQADGPYLAIETSGPEAAGVGAGAGVGVAPMRVLHSSIWGGGFTSAAAVVNRQVDKTYHSDDPAAEMRDFLTREGYVPEQACGMLTAARTADAGTAWFVEETAALQVWATAGLSNVARAGLTLPEGQLYPGTINLILVVDGTMTDAAMVNAVITATEAKAAALQDRRILLPGTAGITATGTTTDAIAVAATGNTARQHTYAGTATFLGNRIGRAVYDALVASIDRYMLRPAGQHYLSQINSGAVK